MHTISNRLAAVAAALAAVAALAGLAVTGLYVDLPNWVQQAQETDLATLFVSRSRPGIGPVDRLTRLVGRSAGGRRGAAVPRLQLCDLRVLGGH